ncbi:hypothetical protein IEQ34_022683 [Dendrobium chrysotoxum]|uniref:Uncharacterized protein n=1 Tax=Dendrobium chrysotoxum TaxID=161865 RepID=A0AAV7FZR1_DENCH|nr:hypothetical protein IEQ34_022683 [Dendrobium chrysotoxum]
MDSQMGNNFMESLWSANSFEHQDVERCPFLRNITEATQFSFSSVNFLVPARGAKGPIFEDGPNFEMAFRLFHGHDGVVPLSGRSLVRGKVQESESETAPVFNPLAAKAASISLSSFGLGGPFGFDFFAKKLKKHNERSSRQESSQRRHDSTHESQSSDWLETGQCPIAKSYRAVSGVLPIVAKALQPPPGIKLRCPQAVVAVRAALARTALIKNLRPQPLPAKILAIGLLGMAANVPLGVWREHTRKFSPQWFVAVHAAVPFIAMLRKSVLMPKTAMAFTIAASILGQTIGSRAERLRLKMKTEAEAAAGQHVVSIELKNAVCSAKTGHSVEEAVWEALPLKKENACSTAVTPAASLCY